MKCKIHTHVSLLLIVLFLPSVLKSQWSEKLTLTSGFVDKNPSFGTSMNPNIAGFTWEFLTFERYEGNNSKICVAKMDETGILGSPYSITNSQHSNRFPSIAYNHGYIWVLHEPAKAMVVWQINQNGNWDIYWSFYRTGQNWSSPLPAVNTSYDETLPRIVSIDTNNFAMVFERNNDIIFKRYLNNVWLADTNLTESEPLNCSNPFINCSNYDSWARFIIVTYDKQLSSSRNIVCYRIKPTISDWTAQDTIAYMGNNKNLGFSGSLYGWIYCNFESNRRGNWNIFRTAILGYPPTISQDTAAINPGTQNTGYVGCWGYQSTRGEAYLQKTADSSKVNIKSWYYSPNIPLGDSSQTTKITVNNGIQKYISSEWLWIVYYKDSLSNSNLYGCRANFPFLDIKSISSSTPNSYSLSQNYPNPFNPVTRIKFDIAKLSDVKLIIYDVLGREIAVLVNEPPSPGTYEAEWDGTNYPSGVYFYKLITADYTETKKMILIK